MKIVFMGTPEFAVPCLKALVSAGHDVEAVFTQPDKPNGRKMKLIFSPVKKVALERGITVLQPNSLRNGEEAERAFQELEAIQPDCIVVAAYGQILPKSILELPKYGCINVHASLLPKYRGAAPIHYAILNGEKESGVTIMQMAEGLDTGDMLLKKSVEIFENEITEELHDRLSEVGAELLIEALEGIEKGTITPEPQDDSQSSYASMIQKNMSALDFTKPAEELQRIVCGLTGFTKLGGKRLKVYRSTVMSGTSEGTAGTVADPKAFVIRCGNGTLLRFDEVQLEGSKRMKSSDFLRGKKLEKDTVLGE